MDNLKLAFESVMPIFTLMLLGYVIKRVDLADKHSFDAINRLVFKVFLPVLLFYNIYKTQPGESFDFRYIAFVTAGVLIVFAAGWTAVKYLTGDNSRSGVVLQGFFRSNFAILGIPLVHNICG